MKKKSNLVEPIKEPVKETVKKASPPSIWLMLAIGLFSFVLLYVFIFDSKIDLSGDSLYYYYLGQAITAGKGYVFDLGAVVRPENHFPPGYPFIISIAMMLGAKSVTAIKVLNGIFFFGSLVLLYKVLLGFKVDWKLALVTVLFVMFNEHLLYYSIITMSEIPFLFFSLLVIWLWQLSDNDTVIYKNYYYFLMLISLVLVYYIKTSGLALIFGILVFYISRKSWVYALTTIVGVVLGALPWYLRNKALGGNAYLKALLYKNSYNKEWGNIDFNDFLERIWVNLYKYITIEVQNAVLPFLNRVKDQENTVGIWIWGFVIFAIFVFALMRMNKDKVVFLFAFLVGMFGIALIWPDVWSDIRFIMPVVPFLIFLTTFGVVELFNLLSEKMKLNVPFNPLLLLIFVFPVLVKIKVMNQRAKSDYTPEWKNYINMALWCKNNVAPNDVICTRKPSFFRYFSERPTCSWVDTPDDKLLIQTMKEQKVRYVIFDYLGFTSTSKYLFPAYEKNKEKFSLIYTIPNPDTHILEIKY